MMDEIICPACGRPNLAEAVKCWYCQEILETQSQPDEDAEPMVPVSDGIDAPAQDEGQESEDAEALEKEIPEWLKRIRALKEAEMTEEEERIRWQQQALFSGGASKKREPGAHREPRKRSPQPTPHDTPDEPPADLPESAVTPDAQPDLPAQADHPIQTAPANVNVDAETAEIDTTEDLPDGYMPLDRE
jgi:hypothetical protein